VEEQIGKLEVWRIEVMQYEEQRETNRKLNRN
jgi:hypothetical protein